MCVCAVCGFGGLVDWVSDLDLLKTALIFDFYSQEAAICDVAMGRWERVGVWVKGFLRGLSGGIQGILKTWKMIRESHSVTFC